ncbi:MAG: flippase-like domain-containing protein, partial [Actinomycetota bacterium]|nr:flippase-like domain-containing protein [Actinomycetota bacterium]
MADKRAKGTIELSKPPDKTPAQDTEGAPPLGRRIFSVRNVASFLLAVAVLYLMYREFLEVDWSETWASVQGANAWFFALAFAVFYCSFPLRALRWKTLLANVGYERGAERPMLSAFGLTRIMYLAWFANCVTVARLGDAYRGYLLK